jgi:hypothetical protein
VVTPYADLVFGRTKTPSSQTSATSAAAKEGGKGRPTPTRREAEARNRKPIGAPQVRPGATKEERKAARAAQRQTMSAERSKTRQALMTGDERNLPARDQGPAKRFTRDYVDARWNIGEFLLPAAVLSLALGLIRIPILQLASIFILYGLALVVAVDVFLLRRRVIKLVSAKFGADKAVGVGNYAMMRALQFRRARLPRPQIPRGQYPS